MKTSKSYDKLIEDLLFHIDINKAKGLSNKKTLEEVRNILASNFVIKSEQYKDMLSKPMIKLLSKNNTSFTIDLVLETVIKCLKYDKDFSYRQQLCNAFTVIEWYFDRQKVEELFVNWKEIMSKKH